MINPLISLALAILQRDKEIFRFIYVLISGYFSASMRFVDGADINRYRNGYFMNKDLGFLELFQEIDFLQPLSSFICSHLGLNFSFYMFLMGSIYGYFVSGNFLALAEYSLKRNIRWTSIIIFLVMFFIMPWWGINVMRFMLATAIFINFFLTSKKHSKVLLILAVLIHSAMLLPVFLYFVYTRLKELDIHLILVILYSISWMTTIFEVELVSADAIREGGFLLEDYNGYLSSDWIEYRRQLFKDANLNSWLFRHALPFGILLLVLSHYGRIRHYGKKASDNSIYFPLILLTTANLGTFTPTMNRYTILGHYILLALLLRNNLTSPGFLSYRRLLPLVPLLAVYCAIALRIGVSFLGGDFVIRNVIVDLLM